MSILAEIENPQTKAGKSYWERTAADVVKRNRLSDEDEERVRQWTEVDVDLGKLEIRSITKARHYAMLAIWILTVSLKTAESVLWNEAYYYLTEKYKTVSATASAFSDTIRRDDKQVYFKKANARYCLTPKAQAIVEVWLSSGKVTEHSKDGKEE